MKSWNPELPDYEDSASLSALAAANKESIDAKKRLEDNLRRLEAEVLKAKCSIGQVRKEIEDQNSSKAALRSKLGVPKRENDMAIKKYSEQIEDILHYIEIYQLDATQSSILMRKLKEARRKKRYHQDYNVLINAAYYDMNTAGSIEGDRKSYNAHFARISGTRTYTPHRESVEHLLYPDFVAEVTPETNEDVPAQTETD